MTHLLDTSALLAHYRKEPGFQTVHQILIEPVNTLAISVISILELHSRLKELGETESRRREIIEDYLKLVTAMPVTETIVRRAVELKEKCPDRLPTVDSLIAATSLVENAILVHRDKHMAQIPAAVAKQVNLFECT